MVKSRANLVDKNEHPDDWGYEGARRFALELALRMTPAERLNWLEDTIAEMRSLCGLANVERTRSR